MYDLFFDKKPQPTKAEQLDSNGNTIFPPVWEQFSCNPVWVAHGDGTGHWHVIVSDEQYDKIINGLIDPMTGKLPNESITLEEANIATKTFSTIPPAYKTAEGMPRHIFNISVSDPRQPDKLIFAKEIITISEGPALEEESKEIKLGD